MARGFPGWPAAVVGAEVEERADGLHLVVEFEVGLLFCKMSYFTSHQAHLKWWAAPGGGV